MLQEAGFLCLFCTAMAGEFWGNHRERAELLRISLATYFPCQHWPVCAWLFIVDSHESQNNIPINNELYTQLSHSIMSPGDVIAFYGMAINSLGIDPEWWHWGLSSCLVLGCHGSCVMAEESRGPECAPSSLSGSSQGLPGPLYLQICTQLGRRGQGQHAKSA